MATSVLKSARPADDYYAPDFLVEVEGEVLDPQTHGDVVELKVVMDMDNMTSFDFTINNWDDDKVSFKYSDSSVFDVGKRVHVLMGYAGKLLPMVSGQIATMSPHFPESGASTLTVGGLDGMFRLRDRKPAEGEVTKYENMADWQIAEFIAQRNGLKSKVTQTGQIYDEVVQKNQDDATFLMERAKRIDFDCYIRTDPISGEGVLHFEKPKDGRDSSVIRVYQFVWGENLVSFNPTINLSRQVGKITVRGWNDRTKQAIVVTAEAKDLPQAGNTQGGASGPQTAEKSMEGKHDVVVDAPVNSEEEARWLAYSLLAERAEQFITGTGQAIGLPDLRPGDNVEMKGLGSRFDGPYYVTKVEHVINESGYRTQFDVRRIYDGIMLL
ncbi:phage late control D family protein [Mesorhizobium muleiense]|uniref:phage late control D family protein n=1 Tax=Mesorhizobium muleiense TaxID=1004279 RepID=UPI003AFA605B